MFLVIHRVVLERSHLRQTLQPCSTNQIRKQSTYFIPNFYSLSYMHYGIRLLDFAHPVDEAQLEDLLKACQPGVDQPEARTMDERHFATHLSPADLGIVEIIHDILLQGYPNRRSIRVELSKLNVYGITYL